MMAIVVLNRTYKNILIYFQEEQVAAIEELDYKGFIKELRLL
jgi:hypothetical protein